MVRVRRRRGRSTLARVAALSIIVISLAAVGPLRAEPLGAARLAAITREVMSLRTLEVLRTEVGLLADGVAGVRTAIADVSSRASGAQASLRPAADTLRAKQEELARQTRAVESLLADPSSRLRTSAGSLTLRQATAPLQAVASALHAGDELSVEILSQAADATQQQTTLEGLLTEVRSQQYRLAKLERDVSAKLVAAQEAVRFVRAATSAGSAAVDPQAVIESAQARLHEIQNQQLELRGVEAELLSQQVAQTERRQALLDELKAIEHRTQSLLSDMAQAESIVSAWLPLLRSIPGGADVAVDGVLQVCPVDEPHAYTDDWGAPRWAGGFHLHQGNDVFAPYGTPIRAPFDGVAVITENTLGGRAVTVYGKTGYVYNAHLSSYETVNLGPVGAGTIIGYVGDSGDAQGGAPHDHFEWHPGNGPAVDPYPYLNAVC